jgi:hypothetical protein
VSGVLTIEQRGDSPFGRWVVLNSFGWFWDDKLHVFVEDGGTLFCDVNSACKKLQEILLAEHGHKPVRQFEAAVSIALYCDDEIKLEQVQDWCLKATRLILHEDQGLGPLNAFGLVSIDWSRLHEISPKETP